MYDQFEEFEKVNNLVLDRLADDRQLVINQVEEVELERSGITCSKCNSPIMFDGKQFQHKCEEQVV